MKMRYHLISNKYLKYMIKGIWVVNKVKLHLMHLIKAYKLYSVVENHHKNLCKDQQIIIKNLQIMIKQNIIFITIKIILNKKMK
jgi:hypothetical protein